MVRIVDMPRHLAYKIKMRFQGWKTGKYNFLMPCRLKWNNRKKALGTNMEECQITENKLLE
jgi:hypothetical protein